jgi:hypothetical protein
VPATDRKTLQRGILRNVAEGSELHTDGHTAYYDLWQRGFNHHVIGHAFEYVRGNVHINNIEAFWSAFKRTIKGAYIAPRPKHLQRYVEEQVHRFNEREECDGFRFRKTFKQTDGVRLTYKELTSK